MNIDLTPEGEKFVERKLRSGPYRSATDVILEAFRLMDERDEIRALNAWEIREKVAAGLNSLRRGQGVDGEAVFDRIEAELDESERSGIK